MFAKQWAREDQNELSNQKDKSTPHDFQKSQMMAYPLCKCEASTWGVGLGGWFCSKHWGLPP